MDMQAIENRCTDEKGSREFELYKDFFLNVLNPVFKSEDIVWGKRRYLANIKEIGVYKSSHSQEEGLYESFLYKAVCFDDIGYFFTRNFFHEDNEEMLRVDYNWLCLKTPYAAKMFNYFIDTYVGHHSLNDVFNEQLHEGVYLFNSQFGVYQKLEDYISNLNDIAKKMKEEA